MKHPGPWKLWRQFAADGAPQRWGRPDSLLDAAKALIDRIEEGPALASDTKPTIMTPQRDEKNGPSYSMEIHEVSGEGWQVFNDTQRMIDDAWALAGGRPSIEASHSGDGTGEVEHVPK
jgi:hypothetical protein